MCASLHLHGEVKSTLLVLAIPESLNPCRLHLVEISGQCQMVGAPPQSTLTGRAAGARHFVGKCGGLSLTGELDRLDYNLRLVLAFG